MFIIDSLSCGPCDVDADCLGDNVVCFDDPDLGKICKCDSNFYLDNCGICQSSKTFKLMLQCCHGFIMSPLKYGGN